VTASSEGSAHAMATKLGPPCDGARVAITCAIRNISVLSSMGAMPRFQSRNAPSLLSLGLACTPGRQQHTAHTGDERFPRPDSRFDRDPSEAPLEEGDKPEAAIRDQIRMIRPAAMPPGPQMATRSHPVRRQQIPKVPGRDAQHTVDPRCSEHDASLNCTNDAANNQGRQYRPVTCTLPCVHERNDPLCTQECTRHEHQSSPAADRQHRTSAMREAEASCPFRTLCRFQPASRVNNVRQHPNGPCVSDQHGRLPTPAAPYVANITRRERLR